MNRYFNASLPFGLSGGVLLMLAFVVMHLLGAEPVGMVLIFGYVITPIFIFTGIKQFRDKHNGGELFFGQGMTVGFFVYVLMAALSAAFIGIYLALNPELFEVFKNTNIALLEDKKEILLEQLSQQAFDDTYESILQMNRWDVVFNDFLRKIIPGLFFTIIISIILKRTIITK